MVFSSHNKSLLLFEIGFFFLASLLLLYRVADAHPEYTSGWSDCHAYFNEAAHPECAYDRIFPYFGEKTWIAQEIASGESGCNPTAQNGSGGGAGLFQIERTVWCGQTLHCARSGDTINLNPDLPTCTIQLFDPKFNKVAACDLEQRRAWWGAWGPPGASWGTTRPDHCNLLQAVLEQYCPYKPGGDPKAADGSCGTWSGSVPGGGGGGPPPPPGGYVAGSKCIPPPKLGPIKCNVDYPAIPVPGGKVDLNDYCKEGAVFTLGDFIIVIYATSLWAAGIIALVSLLYAGFMFIFSSGRPALRARARERIKGVIWGILILLATVVIIKLLNPEIGSLQLTSFRAISVDCPTYNDIINPPPGPGGDPGAGQIIYPPNLGGPNSEGYYKMPDSPTGEYSFNSSPNHRCGKKELIGVIYTAIVRYNHMHPEGPKIVIGDLNAGPPHASHAHGIDVDLYSTDGTVMNMDVAGYSQAKTIDFGKLLIDTGILSNDASFYNDAPVRDAINGYARSTGRPGLFIYWANHRNHFHIRIDKALSGPYSTTCAP